MLKRRCPFLGLSNDPQTVVGFPSIRNHCHRMNSDDPVKPEYQRSHCLTFNHRNCPILLGQNDGELTAAQIVVGPARKRVALIAGSVFTVLATAVIVIFLFGGWQWAGAIDGGSEGKPAQQIPPELHTAFPASPTPTETASPVLPPTDTALPPTETPRPTRTPKPTAIPATQQPTSTAFASPTVEPTVCGIPPGWVLYIVKSGDTLSSIATSYGVTVAQLQTANCLASTVIYVGQEIYVPNVATSTPVLTATSSGWSTPTPEPANTITPEVTATEADPPTITPTPSDTPLPTGTNTPEPTDIPPTSAPTLTPIPSTATSTPVSLPPSVTPDS